MSPHATDHPPRPGGPTPIEREHLRIAIIGAGMGGLGCALALAKMGFGDIHVYEHAPGLGFVGAGIQLAPNLVRVLDRLGCWKGIEAEATDVLETSIRDGCSNEELTHVYMPDIRQKYGHPHCTGHRASLAGGLYEACKAQPAVTFHFGHTLSSIDAFEPKAVFTVTPRQGSPCQVIADVLLAADGVKSVARTHLMQRLGATVHVEDTGQAAYRVMLPRDKMAADPEMLALLDSNQVTRWIGERRHWICYPIASRTIYNMSSIQPDVNFASVPSVTYTTKGSKAAMLQTFDDFCPLVRRMLGLVPDGDVCEWKLRVHKPLPAWVHGSVALVGDACHPTLPHLNQGASMAIEDGAVLAEVLSRAPSSSPDAINKCLRVYELLRKERTTTLVDLAAHSGRVLHLGEGRAKDERDREFAASRAKGSSVPDKWASPDVQKMIYSHDCMLEAGDRFEALFSHLNQQEPPGIER
ncbi:Salicylate 1-monooxygenase [Purpureocillium takamizusanense]|uniref:Salicylate 1-monooxygenase n=1 Tax=Purpureocillium takamizusanense TaxID=2060973 RepID=A0A9Q8QPJ3_9HYPO|nr:Salicylate 1-monooxygenase [Purpureocillium takamizusanense]UNI22439.1 Salicylate 1-monooxygenase [Purpureocillium takamizusanense]